MLGLIYKDFLSNKYMTVMTSVMFIVWGFMTWQGAAVPFFFLISAALMYTFSSLIPDGALAEDIKSKWNIYALTLPSGVKKIVIAKYLLMLILYLICLAVTTICMLLSSISLEFFEFNIFLPLSIFGLLTAFESVSLPFIFRFGRRKGGIFKAVFFLLLPFAGLMYLLFGDLSVFGDDGLYDLFEWFVTFEEIEFFNKTWWGILLAAVICFIGSCAVSCKVYRKGTEADNE